MFGRLHRIRKPIWTGYLLPLPACLLAWAGHVALFHAGATNTPFLPFFLAILICAICGGIGPGLLAIAISEYMVGGFVMFHHHPHAPLALGNPVAACAAIGAAMLSVLLADFAAAAGIRLDQTTRELRAINETLEARISERTAALLAAEENLRQAQKMEAVGLLTGGIAHDFNNLLTSILSSLERLQTRLPDARPEELTRYVAAARDASTRASNLTHRLLTFSRRQPLKPRGTDINRLVAGMAELIGRTISSGIKLEIGPCPRLHATLVDPNQLEHALLNLCINASDAMPGGGTLRIATANVTLDAGQAKTLDLSPGDYVTLTVADTGTGMTPDVLARIFDPFFTTKPLGRGTGLGLSMIYGFARQSGGHTEVRSTQGAGTSVTLYLPRHHGAVEEPLPALAQLAEPASGLGESILLVEDEPSIRLLAAEVLEERGYVVHQAANAEGAQQILRQAPAIAILVTDLGLPGIGGCELADLALALRPRIKILFITGHGERVPRDQKPAPPGQALLAKPFPMSVLASRVQEMLSA